MFNIEWDEATGGVRLESRTTERTLGVAPRPVFREELDMLGLRDHGIDYPADTDTPILWAQNRQYVYRGRPVFEAKAPSIYHKAQIVVRPEALGMKLEPVDVQAMLDANKYEMFLVESEAIEWIRSTFDKYSNASRAASGSSANGMDWEKLRSEYEKRTRRKATITRQDCGSFDIMETDAADRLGATKLIFTRVDKFIASFSGGKDSQVILDLCTRALPPDAFEVLYSDTGYELPPSLSLYADVERHYRRLFPQLRFHTARNHEAVTSYWDRIGSPSDRHRWCCSIMKTSPLYRSLKLPDGRPAKVLAFEGVRAEESVRRSGYERIGRGVKHDSTINARPIFRWNSVEVFLYLFGHHLPINPAYRQGMTRVGCLICPFSSEWNEMVAAQKYTEQLAPFRERLERNAARQGVKDVETYIGEGRWKQRASGDNIEKTAFVDFSFAPPLFSARFRNPANPPLSFLPILGEVMGNEIRIGKVVYAFSLTQSRTTAGTFKFEIRGVSDPVVIGNLKKVFFKATYCIGCEACEVECPTGALRVLDDDNRPKVSIDTAKCRHCLKCLSHDKGCIVANSVTNTSGMNKNGKTSFNRYNSFGLREEWLEQYFQAATPQEFWDSDHGLNVDKQVPALRKYLVDTGLLDSKGNETQFGRVIKSVYADRSDVVWEALWVNLIYNASSFRWFAEKIPFGGSFSQKSLEEAAALDEDFQDLKASTIHNGCYEVARTLRESPIGSLLHQCDEEKAKGGWVGVRNVCNSVSHEAVAFSVFKYCKEHGINSVRVSDFYRPDETQGPFREFGIGRAYLENALRSLSSRAGRVLIAELNMGLEHVQIYDNMSPEEAFARTCGISL